MSPRRAGRTLAMSGLAFAIAGASCALVFPDYEVEDGSSSAGIGGGGGAGGAAPLTPSGEPCSANAECSAGHCLPSNDGGGKICCAAECQDEGPTSCGTNGKCDPGGEVCASYSAGTPCGEQRSCSLGLEVTGEECQAGTCVPREPRPCPGGLACEDEETCKESCDIAADCANPDAACPAPGSTFCENPLGGQCAANTECESGICGIGGTGQCCSDPCPAEGACGAIGCDATGDCVLADEQTPCGDEPTCDNGRIETEFCDGSGVCGDRASQPCPGNLRCETPFACHSDCGSNDEAGDDRCVSGHWCDGLTCRKSSWDDRTACTRDAQCRSNACVDGTCVGVDCDVDGDGQDRADEECGGTDCDDDDARVFLGQTEFYDTPRAIGSYDFDCDGNETPFYATGCGCSGMWKALFVAPGDDGCGEAGNLRSCELLFVCYAGGIIDDSARQSCR